MPRTASVLTLLVTAAAVALAGSASAAPPSTGTVERSAPYDGTSSGSDTSSCTDGATCEVTPTADAATGAASSSSAFERTASAPGRESAFGFGLQKVTVKVPPQASEVTATLRWHVSSASADAAATRGRTYGNTGVAAYVPACDPEDDGDCAAEPVFRTVLVSTSTSGAPAVTRGSGGAQDHVLTLTASGRLPRFVTFYTYAYSVAGGTEQQLCLQPDSCQVVEPEHAGTASASIRATLTSATVTVG